MNYATVQFPFCTTTLHGVAVVVERPAFNIPNTIIGQYFVKGRWYETSWDFEGVHPNGTLCLPSLTPPKPKTLFELLDELPVTDCQDRTIADMVRRAIRQQANDYAPGLRPLYDAIKEKLNEAA